MEAEGPVGRLLVSLGWAARGWAHAWREEPNLRIQVACALAWLVVLALLGPEPIWWAVNALAIALVLAAELANTALERLANRVHPDRHPLIGAAKDCAAAAVLVLALAALAIAALTLLAAAAPSP